MINGWFWMFLVIGFIGRMVSGKFISIAAGLTAGVILSELWKFVAFYLVPGETRE